MTLKMAVFPPIPSARVISTANVKPGLPRKVLRANRKSWTVPSSTDASSANHERCPLFAAIAMPQPSQTTALNVAAWNDIVRGLLFDYGTYQLENERIEPSSNSMMPLRTIYRWTGQHTRDLLLIVIRAKKPYSALPQ